MSALFYTSFCFGYNQIKPRAVDSSTQINPTAASEGETHDPFGACIALFVCRVTFSLESRAGLFGLYGVGSQLRCSYSLSVGHPVVQV